MLLGRDRRIIHSLLIVEDEPLVAFDNEHFLTQAGYRVAGTVASLADAQALLNRAPVDLVVADVNLAGRRDGIEVARLAAQRNIAVLFVTAACPADARHLALGCLAKPYSQRDLHDAIEAADAILRGAKPGRLPHGFTLFDRALDGDAA